MFAVCVPCTRLWAQTSIFDFRIFRIVGFILFI